jgi:DNA-binding transcriptional LysR family regulator
MAPLAKTKGYLFYSFLLWREKRRHGGSVLNVDIKRVRYFLRFVETRNFSATARDFRVSQPALTKAIQRLEEEIGGALVRREGRNTHLTPLGVAMLAGFRQLDTAARQVEHAARQLVLGDMPQLRIGVMCTIGPEPFSGFLADYRRTMPDLEFVLRDVTSSHFSEFLLSGAVDVAVLGAPIPDRQTFKYFDLYRESMVVACRPDHPFAVRPAVAFEDVLREPYVDRLQCEFRDTFLSEARRRFFEPIIAARADKEEWAQTLIRQGTGITILPERSLVVPDLVGVPLTDVSLHRTVSIVVPFGREDTEAVHGLLDAAKRYDWRAPPREDRA